MQKDKLRSLITLHFLVVIWGFTSILGALISLDSYSIVWYRMVLAVVIIFIYFIFFSKESLIVNKLSLLYFFSGGLLITIHWILFFHAIKISSISITVSMISTGAFMTSIIEPIIYKKKVLLYEFLLGVLVIIGVFIIFDSEKESIYGIITGLFSAFFLVLFTLLNSNLINIKKYKPNTTSFYELFFGSIILSLWMSYNQMFHDDFFNLNNLDMLWLFILSSVCTAYAFIYSIKVMKHISPYTLMISWNLEPVYAIILSLIIFKEKEILSSNFYIGVSIIIISVFLNGFFKYNYTYNKK
ncbi:MAG: DMT family transporter [Flavobacteriaceae bacterium]|nr:DMT family transporter [Flavobacteriaceae bacterium]